MRFRFWHFLHRTWGNAWNWGPYSSDAAAERLHRWLETGEDYRTPLGLGMIVYVSQFLLVRALRARMR